MRPFEWMLAALALAGLITLHGRPPNHILSRLFLLLFLPIFLAHLVFEGPHWQLFPLYAIFLLLLRQSIYPAGPRLFIGACAALLAASLALVWALPMFRLPAPTGPYAIGTRTLHLVDPRPQPREIVVQLWYPAQPVGRLARYIRPAEAHPFFAYQSLIRTHAHQEAPVATHAAPFPLILFDPMWTGRRTQDTFLTEELASHGYIVAAVDHPGNALRVQLANGHVVKSSMAHAISDENTTSATQYQTTWNTELAVWTRDNELTLNALAQANQAPASWLHNAIDLDRVGALGHSFGGSAAMRLLGLTPRGQAPPVKAAVNMDGWTMGGLVDRTNQPALFLYGVESDSQVDAIAPANSIGTESIQDQLSRIDRNLVNTSLQHFGGYKAYLLGAEHLDFTDQTLISPIHFFTHTGPLDPARKRFIVRALILAFFDQTLKDQPLKGTGTLPTFPELRWVKPVTPQ